MDIRYYLYLQYEKRINLISELTRLLNAYTNLSLHISYNWNTPVLAEDNNKLNYFIHYKKKKYLVDNKKQDIEEEQRDLVGESSNNKSIKNI